MTRTLAVVLAAFLGAAVFAGLVYAILVASHVSEPAATAVYGATPRRLWATSAAALALLGLVIGGSALGGPVRSSRVVPAPQRATVAMVAGLIAAMNGGLNLAMANGGPGTGNGVVGGAAALVLGLIAAAVGRIARHRIHTTLDVGPTT